MLIDKYIENALYLYQCVIVPGFGGFIALDEPQTGRQSPGKYRPSGKKFSFNPALRVNDGVLAMYISGMRDISYAEAMVEITHAVDYYLATLEKGDPVDIAGVGIIRAEADGTLSFTPSGTKNFSRQGYGLTSSVVSPETPQETPDTTYEHVNLQITPEAAPTEEPSAEPAESGVDVMKKAMRMVTDAATQAGIADNALENRAISEVMNAVLMEAVEKATLETYQGNADQAARSLVCAAAEKAKADGDETSAQAIDSIVGALEEEKGIHDLEQFAAEGFTDPEEEPAEEQPEETAPCDGGSGNNGHGEDNDRSEEVVDDDEEDEDEDEGFHPLRNKAVRIVIGSLVVLAVLAGLFFFVYGGDNNLYFWKDKAVQENDTPAALLPDTARTIDMTDTTATTGDAPAAVQNETPSIQETVRELVAAAPDPEALDSNYVPDKPFYLIASSIRNRDNAKKYLEELRAQGYPAEFAGYQRGMYMIAYKGFYSRTEAQQMYSQILEQTDNLGVWIKVYDRNADKKTD